MFLLLCWHQDMIAIDDPGTGVDQGDAEQDILQAEQGCQEPVILSHLFPLLLLDKNHFLVCYSSHPSPGNGSVCDLKTRTAQTIQPRKVVKTTRGEGGPSCFGRYKLFPVFFRVVWTALSIVQTWK